MPETLKTTEHAQFYRATFADGTEAFFPQADSNSRAAARDADEKSDPPIVAGFAVYDTTISTVYAVALYPTKTQAQSHIAATPPLAPEAVFDDTSEAPTASLTGLRDKAATGKIKPPSSDAESMDMPEGYWDNAEASELEPENGGKYPAKKKTKPKPKKTKKPIASEDG